MSAVRAECNLLDIIVQRESPAAARQSPDRRTLCRAVRGDGDDVAAGTEGGAVGAVFIAFPRLQYRHAFHVSSPPDTRDPAAAHNHEEPSVGAAGDQFDGTLTGQRSVLLAGARLPDR